MVFLFLGKIQVIWFVNWNSLRFRVSHSFRRYDVVQIKVFFHPADLGRNVRKVRHKAGNFFVPFKGKSRFTLLFILL